MSLLKTVSVSSLLPYLGLIWAQYEFERRKYAQDLIDFDKKFSKLFSGKPRTEAHQDGVSHEEFLEYVMFTRASSLGSTFSLLLSFQPHQSPGLSRPLVSSHQALGYITNLPSSQRLNIRRALRVSSSVNASSHPASCALQTDARTSFKTFFRRTRASRSSFLLETQLNQHRWSACAHSLHKWHGRRAS